MATISSVLAGASASATQALSGSTDRIGAALRRPGQSIAREAESARVRLSAFGQAKSAAADVQSIARTLQDATKVGSVDAAKKVVENFVQAFNVEKAALAKVSADGGGVVASSQLQRFTADNASALKSVGINVQQDGTLAVDTKVIENAFRQNPQTMVQSLGNIGRAVEVVTTRQLSNTGSVGAAVESLSNRVQQLETSQAVVQERITASQQAVEAATRRYGFGVTGASAYRGIFGL